MSDIKPTRIELINLKGKLKLAINGHKLLKKKRDGLILELRKKIKELKDFKSDLVKKIRVANDLIFKVELKYGNTEIELFKSVLLKNSYVDVLVSNIMGVKVPKIEIKEEKKKKIVEEELLAFPLELIKAFKIYNEIFKDIFKYVELQLTIRNLLEEIEKTKRRVNALENKIIPDLNEKISWVKMMLDELERENIIKLKKIKNKEKT